MGKRERVSAGDKAFHMRRPRDLLEKVDWELGRLQPFGKEATYAAFNIAVTVWAVCDWVAAAIDVQDDGWAVASRALGTEVRNLGDIQALARANKYVEACQQIANACKHTTIDRFDDTRSIDGMVATREVAFYSDDDAVGIELGPADRIAVKIDEEWTSIGQIASESARWWSDQLNLLGKV